MSGAIAVTAAWNGIEVKDAAMGVVEDIAAIDEIAGRGAETAARNGNNNADLISSITELIRVATRQI